MAAYIRSERSGDRPPGATSNQGVSSSRKRPRPVGETGTFLEDRYAQESSPMQSLMAWFGVHRFFANLCSRNRERRNSRVRCDRSPDGHIRDSRSSSRRSGPAVTSTPVMPATCSPGSCPRLGSLCPFDPVGGFPMRKWRLISAAAGLSVLLTASVAFAQLAPGGTFTDDDGHIFEGAIEAIAAEGITRGCNPPANTMFRASESSCRTAIPSRP
ncbi:MAG: hypothetical protein K0T01_2464 [Acidimicrobiia bacterium]|nr:hypothetical protein [Acidimicrobiia bacterium]